MSEHKEKIDQLREELNQIDGEIVGLLEKRFMITKEIGKIKGEAGIEIYQPNREKEILGRIKEQLQVPVFEEAIIGVYTEIMKQSKLNQIK
jgi:monofunctional chorismate mutase